MLFTQRALLREVDSYADVRPRLSGAAYLNSRQKRLFDQCGAWLLQRATAPLVQLACRAIEAEDGSPALIELPRVGKDGVIYKQRKLRTMEYGTGEKIEAALPKDPGDASITTVGRWLRRSSIDELPQTENVLRGDMSLVGLRPVAAAELCVYGEIDPAFPAGYISARPGMTGPMQVGGRGSLLPDARIALSLPYLAGATLGEDIDILWKTIGAVASQEGAF